MSIYYLIESKQKLTFMNFLGTGAGLYADLTLIAQTAGYIILFSAIVYVKKRNFLNHFKLAKITVFIGAASLIWMGFSLITNFQKLISIDFFSLLIVSHALIGMLALSSGVLFAFEKLIKKTKKPMRFVFVLWSLAIILGIIFYINYYIFMFLP